MRRILPMGRGWCYNPTMMTTAMIWKYLEPNPRSLYRQLFIKGTRIRARIVYGMTMSAEAPMTPAEIATDYELPVEAMQEAIAYCQTNPPEGDLTPKGIVASIRKLESSGVPLANEYIVLNQWR